MRNDQFNGLIVNDGWLAFTQGLNESDCPYSDDPTGAERWLHGHRKAKEYFNQKEKIISKWDNTKNGTR